MVLVTAIIVLISISLTSRVPAVIGTSQESSAIILGVIATALSTTLLDTSPDQKLTTILVSVALATMVTGAFCFTLGFFKIGRLVRFIPYPVVGGFLAGTGWLLVQGSIVVMTNIPLNLQNLPDLFLPGQMVKWVTGVLFAFII